MFQALRPSWLLGVVIGLLLASCKGGTNPSRQPGTQDPDARVPDDAAVSDSGYTPDADVEPIPGLRQRLTDMSVIHPRPDSETGDHAQHRNAYPGIPWSTHVVILGGAYPFAFELVDGPSGMSVGSELVRVGDARRPTADYGIISWPNPRPGTHRVEVRVTDGDLNSTDSPSAPLMISFSLIVGTERFVFVDPTNGNDSNPGTLQAPLRSILALHQGSADSARFAGRTVYLRGGTHRLDGMATNNNNYAMFADRAPSVFVGYPGETAILSLYQGGFRGRTATDFMLKDLTIEHENGDGVDQRFFAGVESQKRTSFHHVVFRNYKMGRTEGENPSLVFYASGGPGSEPHRHVSFQHCEFTGGMGAISTTYGVQFFAFQHNRIHDIDTSGNYSPTNGWGLIYFKDSTQDVDVRGNEAFEGIQAPMFTSFVGVGGQNQTEADYAYDDIRVSYNFIRGFEHAYFGTYDGGSTATGSVYGFRNSIDGLVAEYVQTNPPRLSRWFDNVVSLGFSNMTRNFAQSGNVVGSSLFNEDMTLAGTTRSQYLGMAGAELR